MYFNKNSFKIGLKENPSNFSDKKLQRLELWSVRTHALQYFIVRSIVVKKMAVPIRKPKSYDVIKLNLRIEYNDAIWRNL
jgi:hypothetical protein